MDLDTLEANYEIPEEKKKVVSELKKNAKAAKKVWLASDEDREGEAISWHLCEVLGLDEAKTSRIVFHEITKPAILAAIQNPRHFGYEPCKRTASTPCLGPFGRFPPVSGVVAQSKTSSKRRTRAKCRRTIDSRT